MCIRDSSQLNNKVIFENILQFENIKREVLNTYYQTYVNNAIDYHYILMQLQQVANKYQEYCQEIIQFLQLSKENLLQGNSIQQLIINSKKWSEEFLSSFQAWKITNANYEPKKDVVNKIKKEYLNLKWQKRGNLTKLDKIVRKRAGLKKQKFLEFKKKKLELIKKF
eukprot:TRINITY_DN8092_c0_g2_i1.p1 TRINITY_DN8092_c0_g2~~TRINITY_DN8092_c0_g2_i1.p1  ORF type:complete len:167 (-),score=35.38 TRINITY_DN8092_c0_g2_i1:313-813(-)